MGLCKIQSGKIIFNGKQLHGQQRDKLFKAQCHYIFQDPLSALNPRHTVYDLWAEGLLVHDRLKISRQNFLAMSDKVGLPADCLDKYPYEFSGGQRQRITLGRALLLEPKVILFDEPTSALDVSTQKKVVELIKALGMRGIFISHDLNVVRSLCDRVYMMKQGTCVVERLS
jgi:ABC-type microcin C transport system duplicated ATPase subunit YejF